MPARQLKPKRCKGCGENFTPRNGFQKACSPSCALQVVKEAREKKRKQETRQMRRVFLATDRTHQTRLAVKACNKYIRTRDHGAPCISCGTREGQFHAGHYKTVGHDPSLRFHEDNIHLQCAQCNNHKSGNIPAYRRGLIRKIGERMVDYLEKHHPPVKLTIEDLKDIQWWYEEKTRCLLEERSGRVYYP